MGQRRQAAQGESNPSYAAKRSELIRIAAEIFKQKGYDATTLNDIAEQFGTDRASLYYYTASKKKLFEEVFKSTAGQVLDGNIAAAKRILQLDASPAEKLRLLIERLLTSYEESYPYVYVYIQEDMRKVAHERTPWAREMVRKTRRFDSMVIEVIESGIADGTLREDVPVVLMTNAIYGMINWTHRWFKPDGQYDAKKISDAFCTMLFEGVLGPAAIVSLPNRASGKRARRRNSGEVAVAELAR